MAEAPTRSAAAKAREGFREPFDAKYPKAVAKLDKDWASLTAFYDSRPSIGVTCARRTRSNRASRDTATQDEGHQGSLLEESRARDGLRAAARRATARWRRLNGHELVADVLAGATFKDGILIKEETSQPDTHDDERTWEPVAV
jgi:putative transposase